MWPYLIRFGSVGALVVVSLLAWHFDSRAIASADTVRGQAERFKAAQAAATASAQQALAFQTSVYQHKAQEADSAYQLQLAAARSAADRYIVTHRMQPEAAQSGSGRAVALGQSGSAGVLAPVSTDAVVVSGGDVQACTDATTYALKAHDWANAIAP